MLDSNTIVTITASIIHAIPLFDDKACLLVHSVAIWAIGPSQGSYLSQEIDWEAVKLWLAQTPEAAHSEVLPLWAAGWLSPYASSAGLVVVAGVSGYLFGPAASWPDSSPCELLC